MTLLAQLRGRGLKVSAEGDTLLVAPKTALTDPLRATIRANKLMLLWELADEGAVETATLAAGAQARESRQEPSSELPPLAPEQEAARHDVLTRLAESPTVERVFVTRWQNNALIVTFALRGIGACELSIPAERVQLAADYSALLECLTQEHGHER